LVNDYIEQNVKSRKIGTADKTRSNFTKFEQYLGRWNPSFYYISELVMIKYQAYLKTILGNTVNTVHTNLKSIRRIFTIPVDKDLIGAESDPFRKIKLKTEKFIHPFLTVEETKSLIDLKLEHGSNPERR